MHWRYCSLALSHQNMLLRDVVLKRHLSSQWKVKCSIDQWIAQHKTVVTPVLKHLSYISLVWSHWNTVETLYSTIYYSKYFIELNFDKSTQYVALWTHKLTFRASYGVSFMSTWTEIDRVIKGLYCTCILRNLLLMNTQFCTCITYLLWITNQNYIWHFKSNSSKQMRIGIWLTVGMVESTVLSLLYVCWVAFKKGKNVFACVYNSSKWHDGGCWNLCYSQIPLKTHNWNFIKTGLGIIYYDCNYQSCMRPASERRCHSVAPSLIGWAHTENDSWYSVASFKELITILWWLECASVIEMMDMFQFEIVGPSLKIWCPEIRVTLWVNCFCYCCFCCTLDKLMS